MGVCCTYQLREPTARMQNNTEDTKGSNTRRKTCLLHRKFVASSVAVQASLLQLLPPATTRLVSLPMSRTSSSPLHTSGEEAAQSTSHSIGWVSWQLWQCKPSADSERQERHHIEHLAPTRRAGAAVACERQLSMLSLSTIRRLRVRCSEEAHRHLRDP